MKKMDAYSAHKEELFESPNLPRKVRFWRHQWLGLPFVFVIPILALAGVFGESEERTEWTEEGVKLRLQYPSRLRYGQNHAIRLDVVNESKQSLKQVKAEFPQEYVRHFSEISFVPQPGPTLLVELNEIPPGTTKSILLEVKADDYGIHKGSVKVTKNDKHFAEAELSTFVFP